VKDTSDVEALGMMSLAASYAGLGFGNAGLHLAHGMSYPVAGMVREYRPEGYPADHAMIPHGMAVVLNAPAVFRFTARGCPQRHLQVAEVLGADVTRARPEDAGRLLAERIIEFMQLLEIPNGLAAVGYGPDDIPALVQGTLPQRRVTQLSPVPAGEEELTRLFEDAMRYW
jgi:hydroxyacid-oxoacid transhydrogenase